MTKKEIEELQTALKQLKSKNINNIELLSMLSGMVSKERIEKIIEGNEPTVQEYTILNALK